ncbi:MAG TPA: ATP-grasp domain-containing protein [Acidimicrobiia bacterium]|nr:ATP-grasp domain-containing protein [Acidimicrobiia bacterium]
MTGRRPGPAGTAVLAMVESNTTGTGRMFAVAARGRGLRPVLLSTRPDRYPWVAEDSVDAVRADTDDPAAVAAAARAAAGRAPLAGLVTSSEYFVAVTARAAAGFGLPGPDPAAVERCRDKHRQRAALAAAGVPVPAFVAARSAGEAVAAAEEIGYPVVVKPADGTGSRGVRLCPGPATVRAQATWLLARRRDERGRPALPLILVEEYVAGPECSVETFGAGVVGVTAKHLGPDPFFVETGHDHPAEPGRAADAAATAARAAVGALGLGFGAAHTEVRAGRRGPVVIEVNPRLAGGRIPVLVRLATGLDLVGAAVDAAIGDDRPLPHPGPGHASIRFVVAPRRGTVRRVAGRAAAAAVPGIVEVALDVRPGQRVGGTGSFLDRVGHVISAGPTGAGARAAVEEALRFLELDIDVDDDDTGPTGAPAPRPVTTGN